MSWGDWDAYLDAVDWKAMYLVLYRGVSESIDYMRPATLAKSCGILVKAMVDAENYYRAIGSAHAGEEYVDLVPKELMEAILEGDAPDEGADGTSAL